MSKSNKIMTIFENCGSILYSPVISSKGKKRNFDLTRNILEKKIEIKYIKNKILNEYNSFKSNEINEKNHYENIKSEENIYNDDIKNFILTSRNNLLNKSENHRLNNEETFLSPNSINYRSYIKSLDK